ncbi:MAG: NAD(+)/NADH kinase, partial [Thermoplasmata archaeon]
ALSRRGTGVRIGLLANPSKPKAIELAELAISRLKDRAEIVVTSETASELRGSPPSQPLEHISADLLLAFGGDGTFLMTLHRSALPLLAINAGTVGFLAELDGNDREGLERSLEAVLERRYFLEDRMRIACEVNGERLPDAINEVVLHTSHVAKMRHFEISVNDVPMGRLRADGMIVATPTGSTAYSMSLLGPVMDPGMEAMIVTSVAPFRSFARSVILDPLRSVRIRLLQPDKGAVAVVDGQTEVSVAPGGSILCYRSPRKASFVRFAPRYFQPLQGKPILPWYELDEPTPNDGDTDESPLPTSA